MVFVSSLTFLYYFNYAIYSKIFFNNLMFKILYKFLIKKWYFDVFYAFLSQLILKLSFISFFLKGERGFLEIFGPLGITRNLVNYLKRINFISTGNPLNYLIFLIVFFIIFFFIIILTLNLI